jgi:hypothetical protein
MSAANFLLLNPITISARKVSSIRIFRSQDVAV